jgi:broad specificity polyphosphatase/5'/3'-nucleotidase SurE
MLRVLLTNDDGIGATGLQTLRRALLEVEEIELVTSTTARAATPATARPWTACGSPRSA